MSSMDQPSSSGHVKLPLILPIAKYSHSLQNHGSNSKLSWKHTLRNGMTVHFEQAHTTPTIDYTSLSVMMKILCASKQLDCVNVEELAVIANGSVATIRAHGGEPLPNQYTAVVLFRSPFVQLRYQVEDAKVRYVQLRMNDDEDCSKVIGFLQALGWPLRRLPTPPNIQAQQKGLQASATKDLRPKTSSSVTLGAASDSQSWQQELHSSTIKVSRPQTSSSGTFGFASDPQSSSPIRPGSMVSSQSFHTAGSFPTSRVPSFNVLDPFYGNSQQSRPVLQHSITPFSRPHIIASANPRSESDIAVQQFGGPRGDTVQPCFDQSASARPFSHEAVPLPTYGNPMHPYPELGLPQPQALYRNPSFLTVQQLDMGYNGHAPFHVAESQPTSTKSMLTPFSQLPDHVSDALPPRRELPFDRNSQHSSFHPTMLKSAQQQHSRPASSSLDLPPLPLPSFNSATFSEAQPQPTVSKNPAVSTVLSSIDVNALAPLAAVTKETNSISKKRKPSKPVELPQKRPRGDEEVENDPTAHNPDQLNVVSDSTLLDTTALRAYASQPEDVRFATFERTMRQLIHNDAFKELCRDVDRFLHMTGLEVPNSKNAL